MEKQHQGNELNKSFNRIDTEHFLEVFGSQPRSRISNKSRWSVSRGRRSNGAVLQDKAVLQSQLSSALKKNGYLSSKIKRMKSSMHSERRISRVNRSKTVSALRKEMELRKRREALLSEELRLLRKAYQNLVRKFNFLKQSCFECKSKAKLELAEGVAVRKLLTKSLSLTKCLRWKCKRCSSKAR